MLSRVFPLLRRCNDIAKCVSTVANSHIKIFKYPETNNPFNSRNMSKVPDDVVNEPERNLNYDQLMDKKRNAKPVLIDVREHSEINETGKLPDSIHIPLKELKAALKHLSPEEFFKKYNAEKPGQDAEVIFSCRSGRRSLAALQTALELGYEKAAHYTGGWLDWIEKTRKSTKK